MEFKLQFATEDHTTPAQVAFFNQDLKPLLRSENSAYLDLQGLILAANLEGKTGEMIHSYSESENSWKYLCGLNAMADDLREEIRRAAAKVIKAVEKRFREVSFLLQADLFTPGVMAALVEGCSLAASAGKSLKKQQSNEPILERVYLVTDAEPVDTSLEDAVNNAAISCESTRWARELTDMPANLLTPADLAKKAEELADELGYRCTVMEVDQLEELGMNGILRVGAGSINAPRLILIDSNPDSDEPPVALVGKGITFDSGGISIKPSKDMHEMRGDMGGAAVVLAAARALGRIGFKRRFLTVIPAAENMTGSNAQRPGDVITMFDGSTVEVLNTDAEGRLVLADAIAYVDKEYEPRAIIDVATLTGAVVIALGSHAIGMMSSDDDLAEALSRAGDSTYERVWRLPMFDEYKKQLESSIADLQNIGGREAGTITAGWFVRHFAGERPWAHLDIAGVSWPGKARGYLPSGPTGTGTRLLVELLMHQWPESLA